MTFTAAKGMLLAADIVDFLVAQGLPAYDSKMPVSPDQVIVVTCTGGPGLTQNQAFDNITAQLHYRGAQNDPATCEEMAWTVDHMFVPPPPAPPMLQGNVGSQFVSQISRTGGPPAIFGSVDGSRRLHITGNYVFTVARV